MPQSMQSPGSSDDACRLVLSSFPPFFREMLDSMNDGVYIVDTGRRILFWNRAAERITGYSKEELTGRHCFDNILRHIDESGRALCLHLCPLARSLKSGCKSSADIYLHHRNGHRIPVHVKVIPVHEEDGTIAGSMELFNDSSSDEKLQQRIDELEKLSYLDPLTRLPNRRFLETNLGLAFEESSRYGWSFGLLFIDIDHFKNFNDRFGHAAGDEVLKTVGNTLQHNIRPFDTLGRWGGEEFLALIRNVSPQDLQRIAEKLRILTAASSIPALSGEAVTISIGAAMNRKGDDSRTILERADGLLYRSKSQGRNRITAED